MISVDNRPVEVVEPSSPPPSEKDHNLASPPRSPEIRVTDSPPMTPSSPGSPGNHSNISSSLLNMQPSSPVSSTTPPMGSPTITTPPLLFQPFLPSSANKAPLHHRTLPFSIDNILRPTFGPRLLLQSMAAAAAVAAQQQQQQLQQQEQQQRLLPSLSSSPMRRNSSPSSNLAVPSTKSYPTTTQSPMSSSSSSSSPATPFNNNNQPVDLSKQTEGCASSKSNDENNKDNSKGKDDSDLPPGMVRGPNGQLWPAWVFCTRYSDRPSSGPRARKIKKRDRVQQDEKRPRTAFSSEQLARLRKEFEENRYLNEDRRRSLANELGLNETQIKIWFQNKRAKLKKASGDKGDLAKMLAAQGLYNHATVPVDEDEYPNV